MTEEKLREITAELKAAIDQERVALGPILTALSQGHQELRVDVDRAAQKLADVTAALVAADGALSQRLDRLEQLAATFNPNGSAQDTVRVATELGLAPGTVIEYVGPPRDRPGLLSRLFRKR